MTEEIPISQVNKELYEVLADKSLTFGCKIQLSDYSHDDPYLVKIISRSQDDDPACYLAIGVDGTGERFISPGIFDEIIGHEPTISDILLKLGEIVIPDYWLLHSECCRHYLMISMKNIECEEDRTFLFKYDLKKTFDEQEERTRRELHDLIYKK